MYLFAKKIDNIYKNIPCKFKKYIGLNYIIGYDVGYDITENSIGSTKFPVA